MGLKSTKKNKRQAFDKNNSQYMASPQKEHGHTRIANEIMEQLAHTILSEREWRVLMVIFRKTYGFNKKKDRISLQQFFEATGIKTKHLPSILKNLSARKKMILIDKANYINSYSFNKNYEQWVLPRQGGELLPKQGTPHAGSTPLPRQGGELLPRQGDTKTKNNIYKNNTAAKAAYIKINDDIMSLEEITYVPDYRRKSKSKYGSKTMMIFAHAYLVAAKIELEPNEQYDANKISKGLSALYRQLKDPDKVIEALEIAGRYYAAKGLDWTPITAWKNYEKIRQWHKGGEPQENAPREKEVAERRTL